VWNYTDTYPHMIKEITHFFSIYKDLEGKRVEVKGWHDAAYARDRVARSIKQFEEPRRNRPRPRRRRRSKPESSVAKIAGRVQQVAALLSSDGFLPRLLTLLFFIKWRDSPAGAEPRPR